MTTIDINTVPGPFRTYVDYVKHQDVLDALRQSGKQMAELIRSIPEEKGEHRYAPGKWTIKEVLCHMMDVERVFMYRALRFSRNDRTTLSSFDENAYAPEANAHSRTLQQLTREIENLRVSTLDFVTSCTPEMLNRTGVANVFELSVLALAYATAGHETHHYHLFKERYITW